MERANIFSRLTFWWMTGYVSSVFIIYCYLYFLSSILLLFANSAGLVMSRIQRVRYLARANDFARAISLLRKS